MSTNYIVEPEICWGMELDNLHPVGSCLACDLIRKEFKK